MDLSTAKKRTFDLIDKIKNVKGITDSCLKVPS